MKLWVFRLVVAMLTSGLASCGGTDGYVPESWEALKPVSGNEPVISGQVQSGPFSKTGTGDTVFDLPSSVVRIRIQATYNGNSSNFMVDIAGKSIVNELLGSSWKSVNFDGTYLANGGGTVEITNSSSVLWTFTAVE